MYDEPNLIQAFIKKNKKGIKENRFGRVVWKITLYVLPGEGKPGFCQRFVECVLRNYPGPCFHAWTVCQWLEVYCWGLMPAQRSACTKEELIWGSLVVREVSLENHSTVPFDLAFYEASVTIILDLIASIFKLLFWISSFHKCFLFKG